MLLHGSPAAGTVLWAGILPFVSSIACGDGARVVGVVGTPEASRDGAEAMPPLYAVSSNVFSSDLNEQDSFLWLVNDLEAGTLDLDTAIELPGGASIWGVPQSGTFYVVSAENLTITKYAGDVGRLEPLGEIGLLGAGITFLQGEAMAFDGPDHGYLFDLMSAQALELDLAAMTISRAIDLSALLLPSADLHFLGDPPARRRGDHVVAVVYGTSELFDRAAPESRILFFDVRRGTFELRPSPCAVTYSVAAPNGDIYFASDPYVASLFLVGVPGTPAPCMVRLPAGSDELDPSPVALNDVTGADTGGIIPGSDGFAYLRVLDRALYQPAPGDTYLQPYSAPAWRTWRIDLASPAQAEVMADRLPLAGGIKAFELDGRAYENESTASFGSTALVRTTGADAPARALEMPGITWGIVRLR